MSEQAITIIGGGLAGCEAAWQAARRGCRVRLLEMKPRRFSPAHTSPGLAELVCSNSLRADDPESAVGLLKEEMRRLGSLLMEAAAATRVPAGKALAVDRNRFSALITERLAAEPLVTVERQEITELPPPGAAPVILATGPLTSEPLAASLGTLTGRQHLAFYDAIAPIVAADSLDYDIVYAASRYQEGPGDYLNCPMDETQYRAFIEALRTARYVPLRSFEEQHYFEGCLPIEVMLARGDETLRFGPMKPVGLPDPRTGHEPHAVVQLRKENLEGDLYNMVGFQTKLAYPEQQRIFRMIPGMAKAELVRLGSIHRNTFVCAPELLLPTLQLRSRPDLLLAGQLTGVEGYVESTAMGLLAGINAARLLAGRPPVVPPADTAHGALIVHLTQSEPSRFQPSNVNFGLFPPIRQKIPKRMRGGYRAHTALESLDRWRQDEDV
ncbi:MAG: methylenetetrahydrofolate--tRNA-(uracil(54)-C(5))-methyltransferase (FADH(2)-oxidizing) TrmFO [Desulfobacteraceae bacterium]|nr:methylenetetrahydrofolate--tRNA-(uracil(54)-C(5))-methyltransferase (FADH(2)-oxidizing) TrmFO [Desulfobacteraceae bacterium]